MKRLTAYVSGRVHKVGYGKKVAHLAVAFGIKGRVEYLDDARAKIIAEGDDEHREKLDGISAKPDLFQPMLKEINKK